MSRPPAPPSSPECGRGALAPATSPGLACPGRGGKIPVMTELEFAENILDRLRDRNPRFHGKAYVFVLSALHSVMESLDKPRHITGAELAQGARRLALSRFGPMARTVLEFWGIHSTEDLGEIVFALVDCGVLLKQEEDSLEDFRGVFSFEEAFERDYPWGART